MIAFVGSFTQSASGILAMDLGGAVAVAGTDYDQIVVAAGNLTLAGALKLTILPTLSVQPNTVFTLIDNTGASLPLTTTFDDLPDGTEIPIGGWVFRINYNAIDQGSTYHNTVTLTVVSAPNTSPNTTSVSGEVWIDQTATVSATGPSRPWPGSRWT